MPLVDRIEACIPALRRYACALTGARDQADDLVQECLARALSRRAMLRDGDKLRAWLFRILLNVYRDERRRRATRPALVAIDDGGEVASGVLPQEDHVALREVQEAIARLPDEQRAALLLVAVEGMTLAEAADVMGISVGTLCSRLARARAALRAATGRGTAGRHSEGRK